MAERYRPNIDAEISARRNVRSCYPSAMSTYTENGAIVYDEITGTTLGSATIGDWAVEFAWQDAASQLMHRA